MAAHDTERPGDIAERRLLGDLLLRPATIGVALGLGLTGESFQDPRHEKIYTVITDLHAQGKQVTEALVAIDGGLRGVDAGYVFGLVQGTLVGDPGEVASLCIRVLSDAQSRKLDTELLRAHHALAEADPDDLPEVLARIGENIAPLLQAPPRASPLARLLIPGGAFVLDAPETPPAIWGRDGDVLWAEGEALMLTGPQGAGKTTVAFQVIRARLGLQREVLGLPVTPGTRRVLYLAMDRPAQARRAAARLFAKDDRATLDERLIVWQGPPPTDLAKDTALLTLMCQQADADTVVLDSLKDAAIGLVDDQVGASYNRARQLAISEGIQVLELHHLRKSGANGGEPNTIADIYGSTWLTSGCGSVISLYGAPGDPIVSFRHLKQPMNEVGPFKVMHDHAVGTSSISHGRDLLELVRAGGADGLTAKSAAAVLFEASAPTAAQVEKARRRMEKLRSDGILVRFDPASNSGAPTTYFLGHAEAP